MATRTEVIYRKNPNYGQPGEAEMLPGETVEHQYSTTPLVLSRTEFNKHGWAMIGMAAFQKVLEDTRQSTGTTDADYEARAAVGQYDVAVTCSKGEVQAIGGKILAAGFMTQGQYDAIIDNWPGI